MQRRKVVLLRVFSALLISGVISFLGCSSGDNDSSIGFEQQLWMTSGHADTTSEAFNHWNLDNPPEVPTACAKCHSTPGFMDFVASGVVSNPVPVGTTIECSACHTNQADGTLRDLPSVVFPSGATADGLGPMSLCAACHQGRASTDSVDAAIAAAGVGDDTPTSALPFVNAHYLAAAVTQFGTLARGGYQYAGKSYDGRFSHMDGANDCMDCHDSHSLAVDLNRCTTCHAGVVDPGDIRAYGSFADYDGDGDMTEGIYYDVQGTQAKLYSAILAYANIVIGAPIGYEEYTDPYFFTDTNGNGVIDPSEAVYANRYTSFTPRLLRAAYNYHFSRKDPGCFAHGGKYIIELLYDSLEDLNSAMGGAVSMAGMHRIDEGHFDGSAEPFRHWDADGQVPSACARCHTPQGLPYFLENGANVEEEIPNGLFCSTCHTAPPDIRTVGPVTFPSGESADLADNSNLCLLCHQGRASKSSVDSAIASGPGPYSFIAIHYSHAAAVFFGDEVHGGYEYPGKLYAGQKSFANHMGRFDTCVECHMGTNTLREVRQDSDHNVKKPNPEDCVYCHGQDISQPYPGADPARFSFWHIRPAQVPDYDGDGNKAESIKDEIWGLQAALYAQMQAYGFAIGDPIVYDSHVDPFFFKDTNGNGVADPGEIQGSNSYSFNAKLLKAAYNYHASTKEPSGFIHNSRYIAQLLVDSIGDLGGNVAPYTWR